MYPGNDMMYKVYSVHNNANPNVGNTQYPAYNSMYSNVAGVHGNAMMHAYGNPSSTGSSSAVDGVVHGTHVDPSMAASFHYDGITTTTGSNCCGRGGRGGAGHNHNSTTRRRGGSHRGGGGGGFVQHVPSGYEAHDNQLKTPVAVTMETVVPTIGSKSLFSFPPKPIVYGSRSVVRICDTFQEGRCVAGDRCHEIHVIPEILAETRVQMSTWLMDHENEFRQTLETDPTKTFRIFVTDLKEVVEVPVTAVVFTKGLCVDPVIRARRAREAGNHAHSNAVMQMPTNCSLYSSDPAQCKWGRWCNQVHIEHQWMQSKKDEFDHWFNELQSRYFSLTQDDHFTVYDPQLKLSISLPKFSIAGFSRGLFQGSMKKLASVCLLYQRGRCTAGSCCNQIHVVPQYLSLARQYARLEQSPDASVEEKQRVAHEMAVLRSPCVQYRQREQQESEEAVDDMTAGMRSPSLRLAGQHPGYVNTNGGNVEDDPGWSGALLEHVQVDEDADPVSPRVSANTSLTRRFNVGAPDISLSVGRQMNSDGSYSFNPYGSVTSLPEPPTSYGRSTGVRGGSGLTMEGSGVVQYTPSCVQLHATGAKGARRLVAVIPSEASSSLTEMHRADEMGISSTLDGFLSANVVGRQMHTPRALRTGGSGTATRGALYHRSAVEGSFDGQAVNARSTSLHPLESEASLQFSPSPLNFDASNTSLYHNSSASKEASSNNLRLASSNSSMPFPGNSLNSQPGVATSTQPSAGVTAPKNLFSPGPALLRRRLQPPPTAALAEASMQPNYNPSMGGSCDGR